MTLIKGAIYKQPSAAGTPRNAVHGELFALLRFDFVLRPSFPKGAAEATCRCRLPSFELN
jgi:hypothetical protein